jgi:hypothetical protein
MSRFLRLAAAVMALALLPAMGALAEPDGTATVAKGESWEFGAVALAGTNMDWHGGLVAPVGPTQTCNKDLTTTCDTFLVELSNPVDEAVLAENPAAFNRRNVTVTLGNYVGDPDLAVFEADAEGNRGALLGTSGNATFDETVSTIIRTDGENPSKWIIVDVIYWAHAGPYDGLVQF